MHCLRLLETTAHTTISLMSTFILMSSVAADLRLIPVDDEALFLLSAALLLLLLLILDSLLIHNSLSEIKVSLSTHCTRLHEAQTPFHPFEMRLHNKPQTDNISLSLRDSNIHECCAHLIGRGFTNPRMRSLDLQFGKPFI